MANIKVAIDFVLRQEDSTLSGEITTLPGDKGGPTRFGLASTAHPELIASGYFDASKVSTTAALAIAEQVYAKQYANPLSIGAITDQAAATAVLSLGINAGLIRAGRVLQKSCIALGHQVASDGKIGPITIAAANACSADGLLAEYSKLALAYYTALAQSTPTDAPFLKGWTNRVAAWTHSAASLRAQALAG